MSQFSIPLNPIASPTNQFVTPNVSPPSNQNAGQMAQFAAALAHVAPELQQVFSNKFQAHVENSQAQANADFQQKRYANTKALKAAVDRGEIAQADNPWYMVQLRQDVAANDAADAVRQMQTDWETSPVRFSDDPKAVEDWAKQHVAPTIDGRDAYESEAMAPVLQGGVNQLLSQHQSIRRSEREAERVTNFQQRVSTALTGQNAPDVLNALIADARLAMPGAQVNALVVRAAQEQAEATGDESVLSALSSVPNAGAGGTLADFPEIKKLQAELPLMRMRRSMQIDSMLEEQRKQQQEATKEAALNGLMQAGGGDPAKVRITPQMAQKLGIPFKDVIEINEAAIRYGQTLDEQGDKQAALVDKANARTAKALQGQTQAALASGKIKLTDPEVMDTWSRLSATDPDAANQYSRFLSDLYDMQGRGSRVYARDSDPETYHGLWQLAKAGKLDAATLIPQAQKLSHEDWTRLYHETVKVDKASTLSDLPMAKYDALLKDMIVYPKLGDFLNVSDAEKDPEIAGRVLRAQTKLAEVMQLALSTPGFAQLPHDEQIKRQHALLDAVAQQFGGLTDQQRQQAVEKQSQAEEKARVEVYQRLHPKNNMNVSTTKNGVTMIPGRPLIGASTWLTESQREVVRDVRRSLVGDDPRSLENIFQHPELGENWNTFRSDWTGPNSLWANMFPPAIKDRETAHLYAFIRNSHLPGGGGLQTGSAVSVKDRGDGTTSISYASRWFSDAGKEADELLPLQRLKLAGIRQSIGAAYINEKNRSELLQLTQSLHADKAARRESNSQAVERFKELESKFRLYDFLSVTVGVTPREVADDYRVLYKYPAAISPKDLFGNLKVIIHNKVPPEEREAVLIAQRDLMARAREAVLRGNVADKPAWLP